MISSPTGEDYGVYDKVPEQDFPLFLNHYFSVWGLWTFSFCSAMLIRWFLPAMPRVLWYCYFTISINERKKQRSTFEIGFSAFTKLVGAIHPQQHFVNLSLLSFFLSVYFFSLQKISMQELGEKKKQKAEQEEGQRKVVREEGNYVNIVLCLSVSLYLLFLSFSFLRSGLEQKKESFSSVLVQK